MQCKRTAALISRKTQGADGEEKVGQAQLGRDELLKIALARMSCQFPLPEAQHLAAAVAGGHCIGLADHTAILLAFFPVLVLRWRGSRSNGGEVELMTGG